MVLQVLVLDVALLERDLQELVQDIIVLLGAHLVPAQDVALLEVAHVVLVQEIVRPVVLVRMKSVIAVVMIVWIEKVIVAKFMKAHTHKCMWQISRDTLVERVLKNSFQGVDRLKFVTLL